MERAYNGISTALQGVKASSKLRIMRDWNAVVGEGREGSPVRLMVLEGRMNDCRCYSSPYTDSDHHMVIEECALRMKKERKKVGH